MTKDVIGVKELQNKIDAIAGSVHPRIVASACRAALKPVLDDARANAPQGKVAHRTHKGRLVAPGFLKRNIKLRKMRFSDKSRVGYSLAARKEAWYGKLIETGYRAGGRSKTVKAASRFIGSLSGGRLSSLGDKRTVVPGRPWLGPAYESNKEKTEQLFKEKILERIKRAMKKR